MPQARSAENVEATRYTQWGDVQQRDIYLVFVLISLDRVRLSSQASTLKDRTTHETFFANHAVFANKTRFRDLVIHSLSPSRIAHSLRQLRQSITGLSSILYTSPTVLPCLS